LDNWSYLGTIMGVVGHPLITGLSVSASNMHGGNGILVIKFITFKTFVDCSTIFL